MIFYILITIWREIKIKNIQIENPRWGTFIYIYIFLPRPALWWHTPLCRPGSRSESAYTPGGMYGKPFLTPPCWPTEQSQSTEFPHTLSPNKWNTLSSALCIELLETDTRRIAAQFNLCYAPPEADISVEVFVFTAIFWASRACHNNANNNKLKTRESSNHRWGVDEELFWIPMTAHWAHSCEIIPEYTFRKVCVTDDIQQYAYFCEFLKAFECIDVFDINSCNFF